MRHEFTDEEANWVLVSLSERLQLQRTARTAFQELTPWNLRAIASCNDNIACLENLLSDFALAYRDSRETHSGLERA